MLKIFQDSTSIEFEPNNDFLCITAYGKRWETADSFTLKFLKNHKIYVYRFCEARLIKSEEYITGTCRCIRVKYDRFAETQLSFELLLKIDKRSDIYAELIPIHEDESIEIQEIVFPSSFSFKDISEATYTVLPMMQGVLIPNGLSEHVENFEPKCFYERGAYMSFYAQVERGKGMVTICETPCDAGYRFVHSGSGNTNLSLFHMGSMKKIGYTRKIRICLADKCDYNKIAKIFRDYVHEKGQYVTLQEKIARKKVLKKMIGSPVIHIGILYQNQKSSAMYDYGHPENNYKFVSYGEYLKKLERLCCLGLKKAYLHIDGWGKAGYDNQHPDILPVNEAAGGKNALKNFLMQCKKHKILTALHDQYRDYYLDAESFDENNCIVNEKGETPSENTWPGGTQKYLCTLLAKEYIRRNYDCLKKDGICPDGVYLDVFSIICAEECYHPEHKMDRRANFEARISCFEEINSRGMILSSEEPTQWSIPYIDLVHHAPCVFPVEEFPKHCVHIPLFNLVFHDCMLVPWGIRKNEWGIPSGRSGYLYAILNGGLPYLPVDADESELKIVEQVCDFHAKVWKSELVKHEFVEGKEYLQRSFFSNGYAVEVNFQTEEFKIINYKNK